jgi:hypothetical protein
VRRQQQQLRGLHATAAVLLQNAKQVQRQALALTRVLTAKRLTPRCRWLPLMLDVLLLVLCCLLRRVPVIANPAHTFGISLHCASGQSGWRSCCLVAGRQQPKQVTIADPQLADGGIGRSFKSILRGPLEQANSLPSCFRHTSLLAARVEPSGATYPLVQR